MSLKKKKNELPSYIIELNLYRLCGDGHGGTYISRITCCREGWWVCVVYRRMYPMHHLYGALLLYKIDEYQSDHVIYTIIKEMVHILDEKENYWPYMRLCSQYFGQDSHLTCKRCGTKGIKTQGHIFNRPNVVPFYFSLLISTTCVCSFLKKIIDYKSH